MNNIIRAALPTAALGAVLLLGAVAAEATHSWGGYHWARAANPFTLKLGDNVSSAWDAHLAVASNDWSASDVLNTTIVTGSNTARPKSCKAVNGRVEVCNAAYGNNGWLGLAQIWVRGFHITKGVAKLNDTYFNTSEYDTSAWRQLVMCQEIGHTLGLDHQDESFNNENLGTCMDYTNVPSSNQHPNLHDYEELALIYEHLDSTTTVGQADSLKNGADIDFGDRNEWGKEIHRSANGRYSIFERDLGKGNKILTHVIWAE